MWHIFNSYIWIHMYIHTYVGICICVYVYIYTQYIFIIIILIQRRNCINKQYFIWITEFLKILIVISKIDQRLIHLFSSIRKVMLREFVIKASLGGKPELGHRFTDSQINAPPFYYTSKCTNTGNKNNNTYLFLSPKVLSMPC